MNKKISLLGFHLIAIIIISAVVGYLYGSNKVSISWQRYTPILGINSKNPPPGQNLDMNLFYEVVDRINRDYYDKSKIDAKKMLYGAISGMLQSLDDPYTSFFPPKQNTDFKTQLSGEFSGIGAELGMSAENRIMVVAPLDGSPAEKAGVRTGDLIFKVDGKDTTGWTLAQAVEKIRGRRGTQVTLTLVHEKEKSPKQVTITRDTIVVKSATGWVKNIECGNTCQEKTDCQNCASVAYMRLSQFGDKTNDEWIALVNKLYSQIQKQKDFKGIVLDLRNNPGGYLNDAVFIASEFIKNGVIVVQEDGKGEKMSLSVSRRGLLTDYPLMVLINKGSASASEIVAGALRDHGRAKLVGENSFGKGTVQQAVDVDSGASVHVSVAKWLTPNGTWVHQKGLAPDIKVDFDASKSAGMKRFDNQLERAIEGLVK